MSYDTQHRLVATWAEPGPPFSSYALAYDQAGERVLNYRVANGAVYDALLYLRDDAGSILSELRWGTGTEATRS